MQTYKITQDGIFCAKSFDKIEYLNIDTSKFLSMIVLMKTEISLFHQREKINI